MNDRKYRAHVNDRAFDISFEAGQLLIDDTPVDHSFERVGSHSFSLLIDGESVPAVVQPTETGALEVTINGRSTTVQVQDERALLLEQFGLKEPGVAAEREIRAPMPGLVLDIMVEEGQSVEAGDSLLVLEAMKMENELRAPTPGVVQAIHVSADESVDKEALLAEIEVE